MNLNGVLKLEEAILPYEGNEYYYSKERLHYCNDLESVLEMSKSHTMYRINLYVGGKQILGILPSKIKKSFIMKNNKWNCYEIDFWNKTRPKRNRNYLICLMIGIVIGIFIN